MLINVFHRCFCTMLSSHPQEYVVTLRKKSHEREITQEDKDFNYDINKEIVAMENINQRLKIYTIVDGVLKKTCG